MSPVGGVGVNLAVQDAVATANLLAVRLAKGCPSEEELDHDYLWRHMQHVPARGKIGIFNRSYYEEVLIVKVHQDVLAHQKLPPSLVTNDIWKER